MNFIAFPVASTNVFPMANSTAGGQLMTEYNLRSRESIATPENVRYMIGPSYVHSEEDFLVQILDDNDGAVISSSQIEIRPGRGIFNGHYVELLTPILIDMNDANIEARKQKLTALTGRLCVGIKVMYSTPDTMAGESTSSGIGAIMPENKGMMYEGLQVVILPINEFKLPEDVPNDQGAVTAHIKLAEFSYINGRILNLVNNYPEKCQILPASRISDVGSLVSDTYVSKAKLQPKRLYTFSGKGSVINQDTWCDSTDSLMIWDRSPKVTYDKPIVSEAAFGRNSNGTIQLYVPHKQVDGMTDEKGKPQYYAPKLFDLPLADYHLGTSGTVDKNYTNQIKKVAERINEIYRMPNGKQLYYMETLGYKSDDSMDKDLPDINDSWKPGDYIVVGEDTTIGSIAGGRSPSTMYVVLPGTVKRIAADDTTSEVAKKSKIVEDLQLKYDESIVKYDDAKTAYEDISGIVDQLEKIVSYLTIRNPIPEEDRTYIESVLSAATTLINKVSNTSIPRDDGTVDIFKEYKLSINNLSSAAGNLTTKLSEMIAEVKDAEKDGVSNFENKMHTMLGDISDNVASSISTSVSNASDYSDKIDTWVNSVKDKAKIASDVISDDSSHQDCLNTAKSLYDNASTIQAGRLTSMTSAQENMDLAKATLYGARLELAEANGALLVTSTPVGVELDSKEVTEDPKTFTIDEINERFWELGNGRYKGTIGEDYFTLNYINDSKEVTSYYYIVAETGPKEFSDAIYLTRELPLAQTDTIGGFLNISDDYTDAGYVQLDDTGHLRLVDYELLRSGTLAYQLGENFTCPSGLTTEGIQENLDEYVNQRVAFPNYNQKQVADLPNVIHVTIDIPEESENSTINIHDIDCRFNTSLYLHINGNANKNTTINICDCQKIRIDSNISGEPIINLYRSNLYYDDVVLDYLSTIEDMQLWYERFEEDDPNLVVDNMTVTEVDVPIIPEELEYWNEKISNDYHLMLALRSLTFSSSGNIIGCSLYVKNDSTYNVELGKSVIMSEFEIPQGVGLMYPRSKMVIPLKVTGSFIVAYPSDNGYIIADTKFTALSQVYDQYDTANVATKGSISFYIDADEVANIYPSKAESIDGWEPGSFHIFSGGAM